MSYYTVILDFDNDIPKSKQNKLLGEIYDRAFRIEWFIKSINFDKKTDIKFKKNNAIITFYTTHNSKLNKDYEKAYSKCTTSKQKTSLSKKYRHNIKTSIKKFKKTLENIILYLYLPFNWFFPIFN